MTPSDPMLPHRPADAVTGNEPAVPGRFVLGTVLSALRELVQAAAETDPSFRVFDSLECTLRWPVLHNKIPAPPRLAHMLPALNWLAAPSDARRRSPSPRRRQASKVGFLALQWLGAEAVPTLLGFIERHSLQSGRAVKVLGRIGPTAVSASQLLVEMMTDPRPAVRYRAVQALGRIGPAAFSGAVPQLIAALADPRRRVRFAAMRLLGRLGAAAESAVPVLVERLGDADPHTRSLAAAALSQTGSAAVSALANRLPIAGLCVGSARKIVRMLGPAAVPVLAARLRSGEPAVARIAAQVLAEMVREVPEAVPVLREALGHADADVRRRAAEGLGPVAERTDDAARAALAAACDDPDRSVRRAALRSLARAVPAEAALPRLLAALDSGDAKLRRAAAQGMVPLGPAAAPALPTLIGLLSDADALVACAALATMGRIGPAAEPAASAVEEATNHPDLRVRLEAIAAIRRIRLLGCLSTLDRLAADPDKRVADRASGMAWGIRNSQPG